MLLQGVADLFLGGKADQYPSRACETAGRDEPAVVLCKSWAAWPYIINRTHHEEALHPFMSQSPGGLLSLPPSTLIHPLNNILKSSAPISYYSKE